MRLLRRSILGLMIVWLRLLMIRRSMFRSKVEESGIGDEDETGAESEDEELFMQDVGGV